MEEKQNQVDFAHGVWKLLHPHSPPCFSLPGRVLMFGNCSNSPVSYYIMCATATSYSAYNLLT